jgi:hypothetical protein
MEWYNDWLCEVGTAQVDLYQQCRLDVYVWIYDSEQTVHTISQAFWGGKVGSIHTAGSCSTRMHLVRGQTYQERSPYSTTTTNERAV